MASAVTRMVRGLAGKADSDAVRGVSTSTHDREPGSWLWACPHDESGTGGAGEWTQRRHPKPRVQALDGEDEDVVKRTKSSRCQTRFRDIRSRP